MEISYFWIFMSNFALLGCKAKSKQYHLTLKHVSGVCNWLLGLERHESTSSGFEIFSVFIIENKLFKPNHYAVLHLRPHYCGDFKQRYNIQEWISANGFRAERIV